MDDYDPSHPAVVFTVFKWYVNPEVIGDMLLEQYPSLHYISLCPFSVIL